MKERPILFSTEMVKALLRKDNPKTQTRRVIKNISLNDVLYDNKCPYGQIGDVLWVRETWCQDLDMNGITKTVFYKASVHPNAGFQWRPSIFMPRWASRINLEITNIKVERLQDISEQDARAEGVSPNHSLNKTGWRCLIDDYKDLWDSINGKKHPWASNPWVWVIEFKRI